jgi:hypothetical protein
VVVADRAEAVTAKKVTAPGADQLTLLTPLTPLDGAEKVKKVKKVTDQARGTVTPLPDRPPNESSLALAVRLGWTLPHVAHVYGVSAGAASLLAADGNLEDVVRARHEDDPGGLRAALDALARRAGGYAAMTTFATWQPYRTARSDEDDDLDARWDGTPWGRR